MNGLTVIATHNGGEYLQNSLEAERKFGKWPVLVVDTCSDKEHVITTAGLCDEFGVELFRMTEPRYDFGAYMWAYKNKPQYDAYWFKHDSLYLKSDQFYPIIEKEIWFNNAMIGWHFFSKLGSSFDNEEQRLWLIEKFGSDDYDYGFYGPNLAIKRQTLDILAPELDNVIIDTKMKQQAMERGWAIMAKKRGWNVMFLENYKGDVQSDNYKFFRKAVHQKGPRQ